MTATISSMVMDVSATFVATTTFRLPGGGAANTFLCSFVSSEACSGSTWRDADDNRNRLHTWLISATPGRKTRMPPDFLVRDSSSSMALAVSTSWLLLFWWFCFWMAFATASVLFWLFSWL